MTRRRLSRLNRRAFLRGACGSIIALPFLEAMASSPKAWAEGAEAPARLVSLLLPNGIMPREWFPQQANPDGSYTPGETMSGVIESIQEDLIIFRGVDSVVQAYEQDSEAWPGYSATNHQGGQIAFLTGHPPYALDSNGQPTLHGNAETAGGPSLDVVAARHFGKQTALEMIAARSPSSPNGGGFMRTLSWNDKGQRRESTSKLPDLFADLFGASDPQQRRAMKRRIDRQQSLLDEVSEDYDALKRDLGGEDKQRVERHLESIFEVERVLGAQFQCVEIDSNATIGGVAIDFTREPTDELWIKTFVEITLLAFKCDVCRVSSGLFRRPGGTSQGSFFPWLDIDPQNPDSGKEDPRDHHVMTHTPAKNRERLVEIERWYLQQYVYFVERLKQEQEGEGSLLDNTLVLQGSDHGDGRSHAWDDLPLLLAGNRQGALRTGRYIDYRSTGSVTHNRLLMSIRDALGVPGEHFGTPHYGTQGALDLS